MLSNTQYIHTLFPSLIHTYTHTHTHTQLFSSLQFPSLCLQFYTLINYICESFPDKLPSLPDQLFLTCMHLLETGLHHYGVEVRILCLESIEGVASCGARLEALQSSQTLSDILEHFLKVYIHTCIHTYSRT